MRDEDNKVKTMTQKKKLKKRSWEMSRMNEILIKYDSLSPAGKEYIKGRLETK